MSEYIKDLERRKPGEPMPPINLGAYDNPLLWNMLDPYGADRSHQRRPMTVSRNTLELYTVPILFRDHCAHRMLPFIQCIRAVRPMMMGQPSCHEFESAWQECRMFERYRSQLLKERYMDLTKDYTQEDKRFFPDSQYVSTPYSYTGWFWLEAASARLAGMDELDPQNPLMNREPNRAMMRCEFTPSSFERKMQTSMFGHKIFDPELVEDEIGTYPLPEEKRPTTKDINF